MPSVDEYLDSILGVDEESAPSSKIVEVEQGSIDWLLLRCGKITASRICDVTNFKKDKSESANRYGYKIELASERLTHVPVSGYVTKEMQWGTDTEPFARAAYEAATDVRVKQVGFIVHPEMEFSGASPDGLVGEKGGLEIKCPNTTTHIRWMLAGEVPKEHQEQCLFNMACSGREWWDFMSYDPRLPEHLKRFIIRMERDDKRIAEIEAEVRKFNDEVNELIAKLNRGQ